MSSQRDEMVRRSLRRSGIVELAPDGNFKDTTTVSSGSEVGQDHSEKRLSQEKGQIDVHEVNDNGEVDDEEDPELKEIPYHVRRLISLEDDTTLPTITFRYFFLTFFFVIPGAFMSQMSHFRTTFAPYSVFFVQILCHYMGHAMATYLPDWRVGIPGTRFRFRINPGPFSIKEHALITISAASGGTQNMGATPIALAELYYKETIHPLAAVAFMNAIVWVGFAFAALGRQFLIYDPIYLWPNALMQTTLFETFRKNRETKSPYARKQMIVFFVAIVGMTLWQFLPEFVAPMLSSMAFLCYVAPHNPTANFLSSGMGGMGFANLSFDWANITSMIMLSPWWTQVIGFVGFAVSTWILIPAAKWGNLGSFKYGLMSNGIFRANGKKYPYKKLLNPDNTLNEAHYARYGPIYMGTQSLWGMFFEYASYTSAFTWILTFGWGQLSETIRKARAASKDKTPGKTINHQYNDRLNVLQRAYKEVPLWWYGALFVAQFVIILTLLLKGLFFIPIWAYFLALFLGGVIVVPMGWLYALSNFSVHVLSFNELIYGYLINSVKGFKQPAGAAVFGAIAGDAWVKAHFMLQEQKLGHYMHLPPRKVFFAQMFGASIGIPVNYGVVKWIIQTKGDYLMGRKRDPLNQWTGQQLAHVNSVTTQYVLVGPKRMFETDIFKPIPYGFLVGAIAPLIVFAFHRMFPKMRFDLWNTTIFFASVGRFHGNLSTGYVSRFIGGYICMRWAFKHRFEMWKQYNYVIAAAFDAGFNFNMLIVFLLFGSFKIIQMPSWFANNSKSVERCFAMEGKRTRGGELGGLGGEEEGGRRHRKGGFGKNSTIPAGIGGGGGGGDGLFN